MTAGGPPADRDQVGRIPLNTFAIAFGLAGLAEVWANTCRALAWPQSSAQIAWIGASIAWIVADRCPHRAGCSQQPEPRRTAPASGAGTDRLPRADDGHAVGRGPV